MPHSEQLLFHAPVWTLESDISPNPRQPHVVVYGEPGGVMAEIRAGGPRLLANRSGEALSLGRRWDLVRPQAEDPAKTNPKSPYLLEVHAPESYPHMQLDQQALQALGDLITPLIGANPDVAAELRGQGFKALAQIANHETDLRWNYSSAVEGPEGLMGIATVDRGNVDLTPLGVGALQTTESLVAAGLRAVLAYSIHRQV